MKRSISATDLLLFVEAWLLLARIDLTIRLRPYRRWRHWLKEEELGSDSPPLQRIPPLVTAVERAARHHYAPMNCLRRSVALQHLLLRRGIGSRLHLGVRRGSEGLEAHAWLSSNGRILNDTPDAGTRYAELAKEDRERFLEGESGSKQDRPGTG